MSDREENPVETVSWSANEFTLRIACSKGTYIRTLCHDIGAALGCGGTLSSLRRTKAGVFTAEASHTLESVLAAILTDSVSDFTLPVDSIFSEFPAITLPENETRKCKNGAPCHLIGLPDGKYRFYGPDGEFLLLGEVNENKVRVIKSFYEVNQI